MSVLFDQLRISDDGKRMYINLHVNEASYFDNVYLDSITIMTADKVSETTPEIPTDDFIYQASFGEAEKTADLVFQPSDFLAFQGTDFSKDLFFVYVEVKGTPDLCTPCRLDEKITLGVTFDENLLYQRVMDYTKELTASCSVSTGFADFILLWNAFKASVETEHYISAIKFYNMLFGIYDESETRDGSHSPYGKSNNVAGPKPCNCHG